VVEEVAYTWFNRLIAIRFMEVNDYLPSRIRVLSSESSNKAEPDLVTHPMDANFEYTPYEKDRIMQFKNDNKLDELFRMLFIKQCNALNSILPELFEKTSDFTELLLNVSFTDQDGVVYHLVNDIPEDDFNVSKAGQVEIIGWMYQYYNTEPKNETFALLKKNIKITKERIPAATQLFTPDWIVRYMVENSLGRLWLEGHPNDVLKSRWKYYLDEAEQEADVQKQLAEIREEYKKIKPEDIRFIDPCMGSGHILVYVFDVLMQIYESCGYSQKDAAKSIIENNLYGLDIDNRAYQLAYFAVMMKARQYNRHILNGETVCHVYAIQESNNINRNHLNYFGAGMNEMEKNTAMLQMQGLLDTFIDAKEYGSILNVDNYNWQLLYRFVDNVGVSGQMTMDSIGIEDTKERLHTLVEIGKVMAKQYDVVVTNPPYMGSSGMGGKLSEYVKKNYPDSKSDLFAVFIERCTEMIKRNAYQSMITQHAFMFISSYEKLRSKLLLNDYINMAHLGARAFEEIGGEVVQTTSFVMRKSDIKEYKASFVRLVDYNSQQKKENQYFLKTNLHIATKENLSKIPGMPIAYWVGPLMLASFESAKILKDIAEPRQGLATADNNRFLRFWHEVCISKVGLGFDSIESAKSSRQKWFPYNKGGAFRKWYGNNEYLVNWENDGFEIRNFNDDTGYIRSRAQNTQFYFKQSITWSFVSSSYFGVRYSPPGALFDVGGSSVFPPDELKYYLTGFLCSKLSSAYMMIQNPTMNFQVGNVATLPIIIDDNSKGRIESLVESNIFLSKKDWDSYETSWDYKRHPLICSEKRVTDAFSKWELKMAKWFETLKTNEEELNRIFIEIYGLQDELTPFVDEKNITVRKVDLGRDIRSLISYAVGCIFGRFSLDVDGLAFAGGEWNESKYSTFIPDKDNILPITDEEYFEDDVVGLFCAFLKKTFGTDTLEENLDFIAKALGNRGKSSREIIRNYFLKDFFKDHCKIYQKRPIYWLFDSGKADGFKALVYMHRYNKDTIGNVRIDYLHRIQRIYENEISTMQESIENSKDTREVTAATKRKEKLLKQLKETKDYDEKIAHLALARIAIDLDDGVKVNYEKVQTDSDGKKLEVLARI